MPELNEFMPTVIRYFVFGGLILFPITFIGKFVLIAVFLRMLAKGTLNPYLAVFLGPAAIMLARFGDMQKNANATRGARDAAVAETANTPPIPDIPRDDADNYTI
jgi:hypothetical protein